MSGSVSLERAAEITGVRVEFIRRCMAEGLLKYHEHQGQIAFDQGEVDLWLNKAPELADRLRSTRERFPVRKDNYKSPNTYILPFRETWLIGGPHINHCTRYACDFIVVDPVDYGKCRRKMTEKEMLALKMRRDEGIRNPQDFLCHGVEIISPADGVVYMASDPLTCTNDKLDEQGIIMIDHGHNEYTRLCHVLGRSIRVKKGDHVSQGQVVCLAGGRHGDGIHQTPHLHWDIWDHPHFLFAKGIPMLISEGLIYSAGAYHKKQSFYLRQGMLVANVGQETVLQESDVDVNDGCTPAGGNRR